jgi:hypothetical protein
VERRGVELDALTFANVVQRPPIGAACNRHASGAVGNEEHDLERSQLFVVAELLSAVVMLGRAARHFDHDARIGDGLRVHQRHFSFSAHDGRIGERRKVGRFDANFEVARVDLARARQGLAEQTNHSGAELRVGGRSAGHRVNLTVAVLELDLADLEGA